MEAPFSSSSEELPLDIARNILEIAASEDLQASRRLVVLSKTVQTWINPILYRNICIRSQADLRGLVFAIESRNDPAFFQRHIKRLAIMIRIDAGTYKSLARVISVCGGVEQLAWWSPSDSSVIRELLGGPIINPTHFSLLEPGISAKQSLRPSITHLNLRFDATNQIEKRVCMDYERSLLVRLNHTEIFQHCPNITHLSFDLHAERDLAWNINGPRLVREVFAIAPPSFAALVFEIRKPADFMDQDRQKSIAWAASVEDARFVLLSSDPCLSHIDGVTCYPSIHDSTFDWTDASSADAQPSVWEFVDAELQRRAVATARH